MKTNEEIAEIFQARGIPTNIGFYDHPRFLAMESEDPSILEVYADYVNSIPFNQDYFDKAKRVITSLANYLHHQLTDNDLHGQCINASMVLSRCLEKQGIWNYMVKGALTYDFNPSTGLGKVYTPPIMMPTNPADAGHVWVCAPPFRIVDVTASLQRLTPERRQLVDKAILAKDPHSAKVDAGDLMEYEAIDNFIEQHGYEPTMSDVFHIRPGLDKQIKHFGAYNVDLENVTLKYVAVAVSACDGPLERITSIKFGKRSAKQTYSDYLRHMANARREEAGN